MSWRRRVGEGFQVVIAALLLAGAIVSLVATISIIAHWRDSVDAGIAYDAAGLGRGVGIVLFPVATLVLGGSAAWLGGPVVRIWLRTWRER